MQNATPTEEFINRIQLEWSITRDSIRDDQSLMVLFPLRTGEILRVAHISAFDARTLRIQGQIMMGDEPIGRVTEVLALLPVDQLIIQVVDAFEFRGEIGFQHIELGDVQIDS